MGARKQLNGREDTFHFRLPTSALVSHRAPACAPWSDPPLAFSPALPPGHPVNMPDREEVCYAAWKPALLCATTVIWKGIAESRPGSRPQPACPHSGAASLVSGGQQLLLSSLHLSSAQPRAPPALSLLASFFSALHPAPIPTPPRSLFRQKQSATNFVTETLGRSVDVRVDCRGCGQGRGWTGGCCCVLGGPHPATPWAVPCCAAVTSQVGNEEYITL